MENEKFDVEWILLIKEAKKLGISLEELKAYFSKEKLQIKAAK